MTISRQTHLASWGAWVRLRGQWPGERECAVARIVSRIWGDELVMMLVVMLLLRLLLGRAFPTCITGGSTFGRRSTRRVWRVTIAKTREADWACLHVVACDVDLVGDGDERLRHLVSLGVRRRGLLRTVCRMAHGLDAAVQTLQRGDSGIGACLARRLFAEAALIGHGSGSGERLRRESRR